MCFDAEGNLKELYSGEMSREEETVVDTYRPNQFEFSFIKIPFLGERGLVVRDITDSDTKSYRSYDVPDTNTEEWNSFLQRIEDRKLYVDFTDVAVTVYFLTEQGVWSHEHINPMFLEFGDFPLLCREERADAYVRALDAFSDYWHESRHRNKDNDNMYAKRAIEKARKYRDACRNHELIGRNVKTEWLTGRKRLRISCFERVVRVQ